MIRLARKEDHAQLKALWMDVFGDGPKEVDTYFSLRHSDENMLVWAEAGRIGAMLTMLPLTLVHDQAAYPARYIYAVATAPQMRGRGIAGLLLEKAGEIIREEGGAAALLVPASQSLFDYYQKRAFHTAFSLNVVDFKADALPPCPAAGILLPCSGSEYVRVRDRAFSKSGLYARWDAQAVDYALRALGDGSAALLKLGHGEGVACWSRMDGGVLVRELALVNMDVQAALALLHRQIGAPLYRVRFPEGGWPGAQSTPFGMVRWFISPPAGGLKGYLSLALD